MKLPENAVNEGLLRPVSRLMALLFVTWLVGGFYPVPEMLCGLLFDPNSRGIWGVLDVVGWFDGRFIPAVAGFSGKTVVVSGPVAVFCLVCSAMDRGNWIKVTALLALSTFTMLAMEEWDDGETNWLTASVCQGLFVFILFAILHPLRSD
jgi:hypothetical protein